MEVLNAVGLTPISLHKPTSERRSVEHKRLIPIKFSRKLSGGLAALSSVLWSSGIARALTYEEVTSEFDIGVFLDGALKFGSENALVIGSGAAVLAVPIILLQVLNKEKPWGVESAKAAFAKLSEEADAQLLDIREVREFKEVGSPDIRKLKKKAVAIAYRGEDKAGFLKKLSLKFKNPGSTTLFILDKFDGNSELVAELTTANGFKAAYAIKDGAEGDKGWMNSGLPWSPPKKTIGVDFSDVQDVITSTFGESSDGLPVTLGLAAVTGLGLLAFTEIETVLQVLGSAAIIQFVTKKLLFAEDRKVTLQQVDEFLNTKIAPKELADEIKTIGKSLLPASSSIESPPSPPEAKPEALISATPATKEEVSEIKAEIKEEAPVSPPPIVNSVPKAELSEGTPTGLSRPLSPYPYYPDFKPPTSPSPSQP